MIARNIELLAPAKNLQCGLEAVNHGADAIYIGAPQFGARVAAGNSLKDIESLIKYAHGYGVKVYITFNTILTDSELESAQKIINQCYNIGADAIIVQDMGILELELPPIALHASTQTDNRTVNKIRFLSSAGFQRVILARELSISEIKKIHTETDIELEAFVHGSLCVSYSGQCYMSQYACRRSANRGECAQFCRLPYTLTDENGTVLLKNKYLLSLKDMNRSRSLEEMLEAGISSFKIEGRLKDVDYVKNITAFYRKKLDAIFYYKTNNYRASSSGKCTFYFEPNPEKTFCRGETDYFLHKRENNMIQIETPKSIGEKIGIIKKVTNNYFELSETTQLHHGDGLCYILPNGEFDGFRINKIEGEKVFPAKKIDLQTGTLIYRNFDTHFNDLLQHKSAERKIAIDIILEENEGGFVLRLTDESNNTIEVQIPSEKNIADKKEAAMSQISTQLQKLGNTVFEAKNIYLPTNETFFIPNSILTIYRRLACDKLLEKRLSLLPKSIPPKKTNLLPYPEKKLTYLSNIMNKKAEMFYKKAGVEQIDVAFEKKPIEVPVLMQTKYCLKFELGWCPKQNNKIGFNENESLFIKSQNNSFCLIFNCNRCEMQIIPVT